MAQVKEKRFAVQSILILLLSNMGMDTPQNIEEITDFVFEDVCETADPLEWHSGDVAIAFRRWIEAQVKEECPSGQCPSLGDRLHTVGELRSLMQDLDDQDQICIETIDLETGDVQDLYPLYMDVIDGITLTNGQNVREVRFCQMPNSEPDTRDKQPLVDRVIDCIEKDMTIGDVTVLDELLMKLPWEILKGSLPEEMWSDFNNLK
jgi:hypothetical protein